MKTASVELLKEKYVIIMLCAIAGAVIAIYLFLYLPLMGQLKIRHSECKALENHLREARNIIESVGRESGDRILTAEKDSSMAIDELTKRGKLMGVNFVSIKPKEIIKSKESDYKILPIEMQVEGSDEQCAAFLGSLDELKKSVIIVKGFDITPNNENRPLLDMQLIVNVYLSGTEDAR